MPVPEELLQWPILAGLLVVIGWLLWTQREERKRYEERMGRLLDVAEEDRAAHFEAWRMAVREQVSVQHEVVMSLAKLCAEVDRLAERMREEHGEILARCAGEVRGGKG